MAWNQTNGASTSPCAETYKGLSAQDAPETAALAAYINARASSSAGAKMFVDWHSYSQLFMTRTSTICHINLFDISLISQQYDSLRLLVYRCRAGPD